MIQTGWLKTKHTPIWDEDIAQVFFTSGTEGKSKAIEVSHSALADVVERLNSVMLVDCSIREYVGVPVYYAFGFGRCRAVSAVGGQCFIPQNGFDVAEISRMLRNDEINSISAVPSLIRILLKNKASIGKSGLKLKWMEIGSQYLDCYEKEELKKLFPNAKIIFNYGLTEASRTTFLDISTTSGEALESVGRVTGQVAG